MTAISAPVRSAASLVLHMARHAAFPFLIVPRRIARQAGCAQPVILCAARRVEKLSITLRRERPRDRPPRASASRSSARDKGARGVERALQPQRDIGQRRRLDEELAVAEQLLQNRAHQLVVRRADFDDGRATQTRQ